MKSFPCVAGRVRLSTAPVPRPGPDAATNGPPGGPTRWQVAQLSSVWQTPQRVAVAGPRVADPNVKMILDRIPFIAVARRHRVGGLGHLRGASLTQSRQRLLHLVGAEDVDVACSVLV